MSSMTYVETLELNHCARCGVAFGITQDLEHRRREDHDTFYCPHGHPNVFRGKTEAEKLREEKRLLERRLANKDEDLRSTRASLVATRGQLTKTRKRVANGVCPCCNRSFVNVQRHIAGQHPEFKEAHG